MKNATLRQLRVFASVAKHLSFIRAAEELKLTAPAVSMQIKELEVEVGLPLFDRTSRQVSLTMVGEYVLAHTRRVLSAMRDAEDLVARFRGLQTGPLDVGMVSTAKYFLPRLLAQFREEHPGIEIRLQVANNREQIVTLDAGGRYRAGHHGQAAGGLCHARRTLRHAPACVGHRSRSSFHTCGSRAGAVRCRARDSSCANRSPARVRCSMNTCVRIT